MNKKSTILTVIVSLLGACGVHGAPTLGVNWTFAAGDWDGVTLDFSQPFSPSVVDSVTQPISVPPGTGVQINFRAKSGEESWVTPAASLSTTKADLLTGWSSLGSINDLAVNFTLKNIDGVTPSASDSLYVYFISGGNTNYSQSYSIAASVVPANYTVSLSSFSGVIDLLNITRFGFEIVDSNDGAAHSFLLNDIYLTVPEPETVWMILMVLASLGITFRSRLMELAGQVKARIRA
jgi:hypothetical protein